MNSELARRIAFTLGALLVYRLGVHIPVPGVDPAIWTQIFNNQSGGILGQANLLSGGALRSLSILSLSIMPYVTAAIILQLTAMVSRRLRAVLTDGERGRQRIERWTRILAMALAALQAYGIANALDRVDGVVIDQGPFFIFSAALTLTGGVLFLVWLCGRITVHGIGNGIALVLFAGVMTELPREIFLTLQSGLQTRSSSNAMLAAVTALVAITALVVLMERARRRLPIRFTERQAGTRTLPSQTTDLALKLNPAGVMPVIASWLLVVPLAVAALKAPDPSQGFLSALAYGRPLHVVASAVLILFFTFVYTAFVCDPADMAEKLKAQGGVIPGIAMGEASAEYLDRALSRTALMGAVYLTVVVMLPEVTRMILPDLPLYVGGTSLLVLVCVTLDIEAQVRAHLAHSC